MIPRRITTAQVEEAIGLIIRDGGPQRRRGREYCLATRGEHLPPKCTIAVVHQVARREFLSSGFSGGSESNEFLRRRGFAVVPCNCGGSVVIDSPRAEHDFGTLLQSLRAADLQFSSEAVANYVFALQTKRFAILTGISGTGKTRIAMAVARAFPARIQDRWTLKPAEADMSDDTIPMTAMPYHFKYRQIILPVAFVARIDSFLVPNRGFNSGEIAVSYPEGLTKVRFWRDPNPARNVMWEMPLRCTSLFNPRNPLK